MYGMWVCHSLILFYILLFIMCGNSCSLLCVRSIIDKSRCCLVCCFHICVWIVCWLGIVCLMLCKLGCAILVVFFFANCVYSVACEFEMLFFGTLGY